MKYAAYFDSAIPVAKERARADVIAETLYLVNYAEDLGFDAAFFPEHHFTAEGYDPTPLVMSALAAARTSRIIIGTGIVLLPMHHPLHVAEQAAVIDMASGGRFHLGVGLGYRRWRSSGSILRGSRSRSMASITGWVPSSRSCSR
jgi:alkanesulfonate monooxygenase SsuD/methylene tetrahydromethanopterin reductase-like flavin-dependent oxidoreductase (luciferase family)